MGEINWNLYGARVGVLGTTKRDRNINRLKSQINNDVVGSPPYQTIKFNNDTTDSNLVILSTQDPNKKKINSLPDKSFNLGDYVNWENQKWLITKIDIDSTIHTSGEMQLCNYELKFIDSTGAIASRWCIVGDPSGDTNNEGQYVVVGDGRYSIKLPFDTETKLFQKGKRFLIDYNTIEPLAYKVVRVDRVSSYYSNDGIITLVVEEDQLNTETDSVENMIADYVGNYTPPSEEPNGNYAKITYSGDPVLKVGSALKTFTGTFHNEEGVLLDPQPALVWTVSMENPSDLTYITQTTVDNQIKLKANDVSLIGKTVTLKLEDSTKTMSDTIELVVMPLG